MPNYPFAPGTTTRPDASVAPSIVQSATPLLRGESVYLFGVLIAGATQLPVNETNVVGEALAVLPQRSISINTADAHVDGEPAAGVAIEFRFSAAPGAWTAVIQIADTDFDADYVTPSNAAFTISSSAQFLKVDLIPVGGRFLTVILQTRTNAANLICKATRLQ